MQLRSKTVEALKMKQEASVGQLKRYQNILKVKGK